MLDAQNNRDINRIVCRKFVSCAKKHNVRLVDRNNNTVGFDTLDSYAGGRIDAYFCTTKGIKGRIVMSETYPCRIELFFRLDISKYATPGMFTQNIAQINLKDNKLPTEQQLDAIFKYDKHAEAILKPLMDFSHLK